MTTVNDQLREREKQQSHVVNLSKSGQTKKNNTLTPIEAINLLAEIQEEMQA